MFHNHDDDLVGIVDVTDFFLMTVKQTYERVDISRFFEISKCHNDIDFYEPNL